MVLRDSKGQRRKSSKQAKEDREALLLSKLQAESLKAHGDPMDTPKKAPAKKKAKMSTPQGPPDPPYPMPPSPFPLPNTPPDPEKEKPNPVPLPS
jgi:hypothetical protein